MAAKDTVKKIQFFGLASSLAAWRNLVGEITQQIGTDIVKEQHNASYTVYLTLGQMEDLTKKLWFAQSGTGKLADGQPLCWNDCISFRQIKVKSSRKTAVKN